MTRTVQGERVNLSEPVLLQEINIKTFKAYCINCRKHQTVESDERTPRTGLRCPSCDKYTCLLSEEVVVSKKTKEVETPRRFEPTRSYTKKR